MCVVVGSRVIISDGIRMARDTCKVCIARDSSFFLFFFNFLFAFGQDCCTQDCCTCRCTCHIPLSSTYHPGRWTKVYSNVLASHAASPSNIEYADAPFSFRVLVGGCTALASMLVRRRAPPRCLPSALRLHDGCVRQRLLWRRSDR